MPSLVGRRRRPAVALVFTVQDRRSRARALLEMQQRKAALLSLDKADVAHRLSAMRPPTELMDECSPERRVKTNEKKSNEEESSACRVPLTFEEWADNGFPTNCWRPLLSEELYHPIVAEREFFKAKYSKARSTSMAELMEQTQSKVKASEGGSVSRSVTE